MKKTLAFLLAMVMALSLAACGGNDTKESDSDKTSSNAEQSDTVKETEQAPQEKVDVPENLVGTWYLLPESFFDYGGSSSAAPTSETKFIKREDALEFTVSEKGTVMANGKECYLNSSSDKEYNDPYYGTFKEYFIFTVGDDSYRIYLNSDSDKNEYVVIEPFGNVICNYVPFYSKQKYSDKKTVELTLDNWKDFFEVKFNDNFGKATNEWGDVTGFYGGGLILAQKDNIKITDIQNGRIAYKCTFTENSLAHFNKTTEEYSLSDTVTESSEAFGSETELYVMKRTCVPVSLGGAVGTYNDKKDAGNEFTARVATKGDVEVTRITGTVTYSTAE